MAENIFDIGIGTAVDNDGLRKGLNKADKDIKSFVSSTIKSLTGINFAKFFNPALAVGEVVAVLGKLKGALDQMSNAAIESYKVQDSLNVVLASTGANVWTTASQLNKLATEQSNASGVARDDINKMQTALLGYTNITKDVFSDTTQAALDMSRVIGMDVKSAAETLGKALDVPSKGLTALTRQGFRFNEEQKMMIENFERQGELAKAQRVILDQVQQTYSGATTAVNPAIQAQIAYNNAIADYKLIIGQQWEEVTRGFKIAMTGFITRMVEARRATVNLREAVRILSSDTATGAEAVRAHAAAIESLYDTAERNMELANRGVLRRIGSLFDLSGDWVNMFYTDASGQNARFIELAESHRNIQEDIIDVLSLIDEALGRARAAENIELQNQLLELQKKYLEDVAESHSEINALITRGRYSYTELNTALSNTREVSMDLINDTRNNLDNLLRQADIEERNLQTQKSISELMETYLNKLEQQKREIIEVAKLRGKEEDGLEVQNQILDLQISAYRELINTSGGLIKQELSIEQVIINTGKALKERAEAEKIADEERKKRLQEMESLQQSVKDETTRINEQVQEKLFQKALSDIDEKALVERLEFEAAYRKQQREKELEKQLKYLDELYKAELERTDLTNEEKLTKEEEWYNAKMRMVENHARLEAQIENDKTKEIKDAHLQMYQDILAASQKYLDAASNIANSISTIFTNILNQETENKLRQNREMVQSDEQRAANEERIMKEAALERYKIEMIQWMANSTLAAAQAALAVLAALAKGDTAGAILAGILGAVQVATVISSQPKKPAFHTGGLVHGRSNQEVDATLLGNEYVLTNRQFQNAMRNTAELAGIKKNNGGLNLDVKVINNAAKDVSVDQRITPEGLEFIVTKIMDKAYTSGRMDNAISLQQSNSQGTRWT